MSDFLETVREAFKNLLDRDLLRIESSATDNQAFGNAVVLLAGQNLRLRVIRDRGETFAEAASGSDPDDWFPLQRVVRAVGIIDPPQEGLLAPQEAASIVEEYLEELETGFAPADIERTRWRLAELERFAMKRLTDRSKPPNEPNDR